MFRGHQGQVTHVSWRPTGEEPTNIFLSSSLDETIRIWHLNKSDAPLCILKIPKVNNEEKEIFISSHNISLQGEGGGYLDAKWCPWYGNLLAGVYNIGLHVWDISISSHTPVMSQSIAEATCAAFSPHTRVRELCFFLYDPIRIFINVEVALFVKQGKTFSIYTKTGNWEQN